MTAIDGSGLKRGMKTASFSLLGNVRLAVKLPLILTLFALIVASVLTATAYRDTRDILQAQLKLRFTALLDSRVDQLKDILQDTDQLMVAQSHDPTVRSAMNSFMLAWVALGENPTFQLQKNYIHDNPNPRGDRDFMMSAPTALQYDVVHGRYHPFLDEFASIRDLQDLYLVDREGNVIYSVEKEVDFGTNLLTGPYSQTGLGEAFRSAMEAADGEVSFADLAAYEPADGEPAFFTSTVVSGRDGKPMGALIYNLPRDRINALMNDPAGLGETGDAYVVAGDRVLRSDSRFEDGPKMLETIPENQALREMLSAEEPVFISSTNSRGNPTMILGGLITYHDAVWAVLVELEEKELYAPVVVLRNQLLTQVGGLLAVLTVIGVVIAQSISRPFVRIGEAIARVADGNISAPVPMVERRDDVGQLATHLEDLRGKLSAAADMRRQQERKAKEQHQVVEHLTGAISQLSEGNLTGVIQNEFAEDYEALRQGFNTALLKLNESISELVNSAREIDNSAHDVENASNDLSQRAIEQAASLEETAAAITQLSASVKSTADSASEADNVMTRAKEGAKESGAVVNQAMVAMDKIANSSQKITQVTSVIEDLAFQTNLLALNAGVEAARAGEAGRGFAVVASEVRALAQRSSEAAKEINGLIQEAAENVTGGVELVDQAGQSFESLIGEFDKVSASVSSIATAAREQSVGLEEINSAVDQLDQVTQKNAAVASSVHGTGKMMVTEAAKLNRISASFRCDDSKVRRAMASGTPKTAPQQARAVVNAPVAADSIAGDDWAEF
ncbi:methyl-accepting chemotaxis protein [Pseudooceanicola antarcticus]|nr:methyl-accepting chemotaxis protein [Pseudooceanicola antarcticus]